jgi:hypothetical protein
VSSTPVRSAARKRISLTTTGQASASTHIFTGESGFPEQEREAIRIAAD